MGDLEREYEALCAEKKTADARRAERLRAAISQAIMRCDKDEAMARRAELAQLEAEMERNK